MDYSRLNVRWLLALVTFNIAILGLDRLVEAPGVFVLIPLATIALFVWAGVTRSVAKPATFVVVGLLVVSALGLLDAGLPTIRI